MLVLFITPSIIRDFHQHHHFFCNEKNEKHLHEYHALCEICNFEFSTYTPAVVKTFQSKICLHFEYKNSYTSFIFSEQKLLSFSLRAPPLA